MHYSCMLSLLLLTEDTAIYTAITADIEDTAVTENTAITADDIEDTAVTENTTITARIYCYHCCH